MGGDKILVVGDVHGHWSMLNTLINKKKPDIILQCGDFGFFPWNDNKKQIKNKNTAIFWCDGNHEHHWHLINLMEKNKFGPIETSPNVFYMPRSTTLTLPDERVVMFFGGADSIDKKARIIGVNWFPEEVIQQRDIENLPEIDVDIMITHTCPSEFFKEVKERGNPNSLGWTEIHKDPSRAALSFLLDFYKPKEWYFAHFHTYVTGIYEHASGEKTVWKALDEVGSSNWWIIL